jgi:TolB-like protein/DNA-binding winged helix-turn-helix (wHTH) protein/Flp pilus assembly protein TadD
MPETAQPQERIRFGEFELDVRTRELQKNGQRFDLQEQPFLVLMALLERPGQLVTRDELIKRLWPSDTFVDFEHSLNKAVKRLREALDDSAEEPQFIETLPRRGYRFVGKVAAPPQPSREPGKLEEKPARIAAGLLTRVRRPVVVASGLALLVAAIVGVFWIAGRRGHVWGAAPIRSLAVLPLENLSVDSSQDYLADGMTDELITSLGQISALRVISRTTAMQYKNAHKPLPQIARELNVDAVVEGSLVRSGDRVRIDAQLIDATADKQLWARSFEGDLRDVLGLQTQVAGAVAEQIRIKLTPTEQMQLVETRQVNPRAYEALLKGYYFDQRLTAEGEQKALQYFQQSAELDPNFARAYVGIARAYDILANWQAMPAAEAAAAADAAEAKALELEPNLSEAYAGRAWTLMMHHWDFPGAESDFRHALELDPGDATSHEGYAFYLVATGQFEAGVQEAKRARDLDPLNLLVNLDYCRVLRYARRYDDAIAQCKATLELGNNQLPTLYVMVRLCERAGAYDEAHEMLAKIGDCDAACYAMWDELYKAPGSAVAFDAWLKTRKNPPQAFFLASADACLGRNDQALAWLEKAREERADLQMIFLAVDPSFDRLCSDPRFDAFLHRAGLPPQPKTIADGRANP